MVVDPATQSLPFTKVAHKVDTLDAQPSNETGGILVAVTGQLIVRKIILRTRKSDADKVRLTRKKRLCHIRKYSSFYRMALGASSSLTMSSG